MAVRRDDKLSGQQRLTLSCSYHQSFAFHSRAGECLPSTTWELQTCWPVPAITFGPFFAGASMPAGTCRSAFRWEFLVLDLPGAAPFSSTPASQAHFVKGVISQTSLRHFRGTRFRAWTPVIPDLTVRLVSFSPDRKTATSLRVFFASRICSLRKDYRAADQYSASFCHLFSKRFDIPSE